jgi:hypothetical protein
MVVFRKHVYASWNIDSVVVINKKCHTEGWTAGQADSLWLFGDDDVVDDGDNDDDVIGDCNSSNTPAVEALESATLSERIADKFKSANNSVEIWNKVRK